MRRVVGLVCLVLLGALAWQARGQDEEEENTETYASALLEVRYQRYWVKLFLSSPLFPLVLQRMTFEQTSEGLTVILSLNACFDVSLSL